MDKYLIKQIEAEARKYFKKASGCHDFTHVERVKNLALYIGKKEKADLGILEIAAILHDIGRKEEMKKKGAFCHVEKSAELAVGILKKYCIVGDTMENIIHCVKSHRFRNNNIPKTLEAKILFDSDKLDSIGAIGVARVFLFAGNAGSGNLYTGNEKELVKSKKDYSYTKEDSAFLEYEIKLKYIKDKMLTVIGRHMANKRHQFMKNFFERFWEEVEGKK